MKVQQIFLIKFQLEYFINYLFTKVNKTIFYFFINLVNKTPIGTILRPIIKARGIRILLLFNAKNPKIKNP